MGLHESHHPGHPEGHRHRGKIEPRMRDKNVKPDLTKQMGASREETQKVVEMLLSFYFSPN